MTRYVMVTATGVLWHVLDAPDPHTACIKTDHDLGHPDGVGRYSEVGSLAETRGEGYVVVEVPAGFEFPDLSAPPRDVFHALSAAEITSYDFRREGPAMPWALEAYTITC